MAVKLTGTKIKFMHGRCSTRGCPVCAHTYGMLNYDEWSVWLEQHGLPILQTGAPKSPWWMVEAESSDECYKLLKGDLRHA